MKIYDVPDQGERVPYNDVCDKKQLIAYVPYTLTPDNELNTNASRLEHPLWDATKLYSATILVEHLGQLYVHQGSEGESRNDLPMTTQFGEDFGSRLIGYGPKTESMIDGLVGGILKKPGNIIHFDVVTTDTQSAVEGMLCIVYGAVFNPYGSKALGSNGDSNFGWVYLVRKDGDYTYGDLPYPRNTDNYYFKYLGNAKAAFYYGVFDGILINTNPTSAMMQEQLCVKAESNSFFYSTKLLNADITRPFPAVNLNLPLVGTNQWDGLSQGTRRGIYNEDPSVKSKKSSGNLEFKWRVTRDFDHIGLYGIKGVRVVIVLYDTDVGDEYYNEEITLAQENHPEYLFGEESYYSSLVVRNLPDNPNPGSDIDLKITVIDDDDGDTYLGLVQPYNTVSLGLMTYAPIVSVINTKGQKANVVSLVKNKVSFTTKTPSGPLDKIVRALRYIARLSVDTNMPTLFISEFPHKSLAILGYMPTFNQKLNDENITTSTIVVEEVRRGEAKIKVGVLTGVNESTPEEDPDEEECIAVLHDYPMKYYDTTEVLHDYPMEYYKTCP